MADDSTIVITDIKGALARADDEAAASDQPAALVVVGGELNGTLFDLVNRTVTVGRNPDNEISLEFQGISRYHMRVIMDGDDAAVEDAGSRNGTYLNNKKLDNTTALTRGDIIKLGSIALKFLPKGDPERLTYDKLNLDANTDSHTGCYNKGYFNKSLDMEVKKSKVTGDPLSLIIFDLDHFKNLNDNFGHDAGDYVLKDLAEIIRGGGIRDIDVFARYGGEEFVILLPKTNIKKSYEIAERLRKLIEEHEFLYDNDKLPVTASIGVADYRQGVLTGQDLFRRADNAVYQAKNGGRNQVQFYRK